MHNLCLITTPRPAYILLHSIRFQTSRKASFRQASVCLMIAVCGLESVLAQINSADTLFINQSNEVENVRLWHSPDRTRVVFDVSEDVTYNTFSLDQPRRLVVDIENANLSVNLPDLDASNRQVSAIRFGRPKENVLRFVFELKKPLRAIDFVLSPNELYGHRLVVDLEDVLQVANAPNTKIGEKDGVDLISRNSELNQSATHEPSSSSTQQSPIISSIPSTDTSEPDSVANRNATRIQHNTVKSRPLVIAIDAGHGGEDPGALGHRGSREKNITLAIAGRLKKIVDQDPRMRSFMVREGDYYIELHKRRQMARAARADIFISIHADAFTKKSARGLSVFALSQRGATSAMAKALATKENASDLIGGVSLADKDAVLAKVLVDLSMTNTISESVNFGGRVLKELRTLGKLHSSRVEQAGFEVLKSADIPSVLIETGFITNPEEERKLKSSRYQQQLATAIYEAIKDYFSQANYDTNARFANTAYERSEYQSLVTPKSRVRSSNKPKVKKTRSTDNAASHKVVRGDSLSKIALRYGTSIAKLKRTNNLKTNTVVVGQRLKIPTSANSSSSSSNHRPEFHVIGRGDSLSKISKRYNVTIRALKSLNKLKRDTVYLGQKIRIPGGKTGQRSSSEPRLHKVKRGDTLSEIASLYGSSMTKIMNANALKSRNIMLGQLLKIPN